MQLLLQNNGSNIVKATVVSLQGAAANSFTLSSTLCFVGATDWSASGGELVFDFNTEEVTGYINLNVTGGITQQHIGAELFDGTFDPLAGDAVVAIDTKASAPGPLQQLCFLSNAVPAVSRLGGIALAAVLGVIAVSVFRKRGTRAGA